MQIDSAIFAAAAACVTMIVTIGGGFYFSGKVTQKLDEHTEARKNLTTKLDHFIDSFQTAAVAAGKLETRIEHVEGHITRIDNTVENLRVGKGWMNDGPVKSVSREY